MAKSKLKIGVIFGGKSAEHEVSIMSAKNIISALDKNKYQVVSIKVDKNGKFSFPMLSKVDVIFTVLHGPFGEDGIMQGVFKEMGKPFVGAGVLGSAIGMDKDVMKRLLRDAGIPIGKFITIKSGEKISFEEAKKKLGLPMFIKPANLGSSVGVSKVRNEKEYHSAIKDAFKYDLKVIIEEFLMGREIECSVLGNDKPIASLPGEIILNADFYSYEAKYFDENGAIVVAPVNNLSNATTKQVQKLALQTFEVLECNGLARVDFFVKKNGKIYVNEINTLPGFTNISMYPKLWEASGITPTKLLDRLIDLAIERFSKEQKLKTSVK
ncbi:D-alanine--D-alanine ligase [Patescibacteria group bacterium]|nr:D-alanine--D-alanine ligase [Patescibacteria group bacterium]